MVGFETFEETRTLAGVRSEAILPIPTELPAPATVVYSELIERADNDTLELDNGPPVPNLVVLTGKNAGMSRKLADGEVIIGRSTQCNFVIEDDDVSRQHAVIRKGPTGAYIIEDLGSRNGTQINELPATNGAILKYGDRITLGTDTILLYTHHDSLSELLLHRQRMESIGRLAGGVAHDFNNLLGAILANVSALISARGAGGPATSPAELSELEALDDIRVAASRAAELTGQLLGFARRGKYEQLRVEVTDLCSEASRLCRRAFGPNYRIEERFEKNLAILGDPSQLHQALMNLLINARDSMPEGGTIGFGTRFRHGREIVGLRSDCFYVEIEVIDHGVGMAPEVCQRVFEPFFTTKELGRGTGLGLATTYGVTKSHGGDVRVASQAGVGSSFKIYLPLLASMPAAPTMQVETLADARAVTGHTVLVVDDEDLCLRSIGRLLKRTGYQLLTANSGASALEIFRANPKIDLVLLDLMMPEMSGEELAQHLRKLRPDIKVLVMSGYCDDDRAQRVLKAGARGLLRKPFDKDALQKSLEAALHSRRPVAAQF